jgi:hypothetical protein
MAVIWRSAGAIQKRHVDHEHYNTAFSMVGD